MWTVDPPAPAFADSIASDWEHSDLDSQESSPCFDVPGQEMQQSEFGQDEESCMVTGNSRQPCFYRPGMIKLVQRQEVEDSVSGSNVQIRDGIDRSAHPCFYRPRVLTTVQATPASDDSVANNWVHPYLPRPGELSVVQPTSSFEDSNASDVEHIKLDSQVSKPLFYVSGQVMQQSEFEENDDSSVVAGKCPQPNVAARTVKSVQMDLKTRKMLTNRSKDLISYKPSQVP